MRLSSVEKETIITFNEAETTADVYTHNKALKRQLDEYAEQRPEQCQRIGTSHAGQAAEYTIPKSWIKVKPPRIASEAQKAAARAALEKARGA